MTEEDKAKMKGAVVDFLAAKLDGFNGVDRLAILKCHMEAIIEVAVSAKVDGNDTEEQQALIRTSMDVCLDEFYKIDI